MLLVTAVAGGAKPPPALHATVPSLDLTPKTGSPEPTVPATMTCPSCGERTAAPETLAIGSFRTHFTRVTATLATTCAARFPAASFASTATLRLPVPSVPEANVPPEKSAGNVKLPFTASYVTVHVVTPLMVHFPAARSAPLPWSSGDGYASSTVN